MPDFMNPFPGVVPDRKLTAGELTRALRLSLAAEQEAVHLYEALADATDNPLAAAVLRDIANEEKVHAGEFGHLIKLLLPDEEGFLQDGATEVNELREALTGADADEPGAEETSPPTVGPLR